MTSNAIHSTISHEDYHAGNFANEPALSSSIIKILVQDTPLHAWYAHPKLNPSWQPTEAAKHFDLGTLCHALLLEGIDKAHIIQATRWEGTGKNRVDTGELVTDYKTKAAQQERDAARQSGKCPILAHEMPEILSMMESCRRQLDAHQDASDAFTEGKPEQTLIWRDPDTQVLCKGRLDWLHTSKPIIDDYKSGAMSANPRDLSRTAAAKGWPIQDAFYRRGFKAVFGQDLEPDFRFVCQENWQPFALSVVRTSAADLALADAQINYALRVFAGCLKSGKWPGYSTRTEEITSPPWIETEAMERGILNDR